MIELSGFTFIMTDHCNADCSYCYQHKGEARLCLGQVKKAFDFFAPHLKEESVIGFYGGEPLLAFDQIKEAVAYMELESKQLRRNLRFSITTNGTLVEDEVLEFFREHGFSVLLSFDGLAQTRSRPACDFSKLSALVKRLADSQEVELEVNSVFTPETLDLLLPSIRFIVELGVRRITLNLSTTSRWSGEDLKRVQRETRALSRYLLDRQRAFGNQPVTNFMENFRPGIFICLAGQDRMALAPDGTLWGCALFADYFRTRKTSDDPEKFCFGGLEEFMKRPEDLYSTALAFYSQLRMDAFFTDRVTCFGCRYLQLCGVCPVAAAYTSGTIGRVSEMTCRLKRMLIREKERFRESLELGDSLEAGH